MKKRKLMFYNILLYLILSLGFILTNYNDTQHSISMNVVTESKEKEGQELEIVPIDDEENQVLDKHDKIRTEKETDKNMKKEFKKPTVEIVEFDNEDVITTSGNVETPAVPGGGN